MKISRLNYKISFLSLFILSLLMSADAFAASVRLSVSAMRGKREIAVGDLFYISYEITDLNEAPEKPSEVKGAKVMYFDRTGQSSRFSNVNGKTTQSFSYTYTLTLRATEEGSFSFGPVTVGGVKSNVVNFTIGKAAPQQNVPSVPGNSSSDSDDSAPKYIGKGDGNLFLRADVSKSSAYEQEALVYTVKLYTTYDAIKFIGATAAPKFEGFVVEESKDISTSLEYETYKDKTYATAIIARYIIFPQMEGQLKVSGNTYTVSVDEREYYHDPFWGNLSVAKPLQLNVTPNDLTISVKPLPKPQPANFSGGVGSFKITSNLPSDNFSSNQAASIVYTVSGTGNLKYVNLPDLNNIYPPELEVYSPTTDIDTEVGRINVSGNLKYDYSFVPLESGTFKIPDIELVYFNPEKGAYETSIAKGYTIHVAEGKGSEKSQTKGQMSFNPQILPVISGLKPIHKPYIYIFGYWLFYIVPFCLLVMIAVYYRSYLKANADLVAVRSRKANKMARRRLKKAEKCMARKDSDAFYDEMLSALWGYLGDKLKIPTSELNRQNVSEKLSEKGISQDIINQFITILDECEFAKYSSAQAQKEMPQVYDQGVNIINSLEDSFKTPLHKQIKKD